MTAAAAHTFRVDGIPQPKGSWVIRYRRKAVRGKPSGWLVADNSNAANLWKDEIIRAARASGTPRVNEGPVFVGVTFWMPRPQRSSPKTDDRDAIYRAKKPDIDKLCRLLLDALTGIAWTDDNQVARLAADKSYCSEPGDAHAYVTIKPLPLIATPLLEEL